MFKVPWKHFGVGLEEVAHTDKQRCSYDSCGSTYPHNLIEPANFAFPRSEESLWFRMGFLE
jgi:hypothetical protein